MVHLRPGDLAGPALKPVEVDGNPFWRLDVKGPAGYSILSSDSQRVLEADNLATPFMFYLLNVSHKVIAGSVGSTTALTEDLVLDITFAGDRPPADAVVFQYTSAGEVTPVNGIIHIIPEPTSIMLFAAGRLLMMRRRRRSA